MNKLRIKDKEYNLKYTLRALFIFESICKKPFKIETLLDNYVFFYSMLLASNPDAKVLTWDEFIDALDSDPNLLSQMGDLIEKQHEQDKLFSDGEEEKSESKKK